jgi:hypothetical protein
MPTISYARRTRSGGLLLALLLAVGCGSGPGGPNDPGPDPDPDPGPDQGPPPEGRALFAVDLDNRLLLLGTDNPGTPTRIVPITGLPVLERIVAIDFRPSNGKLYGVGTDSRVYTLDTVTAVATPVRDEPFSPAIDFFEVHFGLSFDPVADRIRLVVAESGANYEINPDDGSATLQTSVHYAAGDPNEGATPSISGIGYAPPGTALAGASALALASVAAGPCEDLMFAIDADLAELVMSCNPDEGEYESIGPIDVVIARCSEVKVAPDGNLVAIVLAEGRNLIMTLDRLTGHATSRQEVPDDSPIQGFGFVPSPPAGGASQAIGSARPARSAAVTASAGGQAAAAAVPAKCGSSSR